MSSSQIKIPILGHGTVEIPVQGPSQGSTQGSTVPVPTITDPTGKVKFCRFEIPIVPRDLKDTFGNLVNPYPLQIGGTLFHWADPIRAYGWFRYAQQLLNDQTRLAGLDASVNITDKDANRKQATDQLHYVAEVLGAIMRGYNLLNILWWNDPDARRLYRSYVSGPPLSSGASAANIYAEQDDYNPQWYTASNALPFARSGGSILQNVASKALSGSQKTVPFVISAMPQIVVYDKLRAGEAPENADFIFNAAWVRMKYAEICIKPIAFPWNDQCNTDGLSPNSGFNLFQGDLNAFMPDGTKLPDDFDDWRARYVGRMNVGNFTFDPGASEATAPLRDYLAWFKDWVQAMLARNAFEVIQDSRAWIAFNNQSTIALNGGQQAAIASILGTSADVQAQQHSPDQGWNLVASGIAAGSTATGNPIVAVIGGAVSAIILVTNALVIHDVKGHGRDDLGRYKLVLDRAWLSGAPESLDPGLGSPTLPDSELVDPPGIGTLWTPPTGTDGCAPSPVGSSGNSGSSSGGAGGSGGSGSGISPTTLIMILGAATLGYFLLKNQQPPKPEKKEEL